MTGSEKDQPRQPVTGHRLRTPPSAALAGIAFAAITFVAMVLLQTSLPDDPPTNAGWLTEHEGQVLVAVTLVPFAVIAFLWFIGVLRDLLGRREDQFFGTVFLGSGLLFLGALLVWISAVAAALAGSNASPTDFAESNAYVYAGSWIVVMDVVALRMAGVFMFSAATMWLRTEALPRWLVIITYVGAIALLLAGPSLRWARGALPMWVLIVSVMILIAHRRARAANRHADA